MIHFAPYPVYINNPGSWSQIRQIQRGQLRTSQHRHEAEKNFGEAATDQKMIEWLDYDGRKLQEIKPDPNPTPANRMYESLVCSQLTAIAGTRVGRVLLDSLKPEQRHWIVPFNFAENDDCQCPAYTFPGPLNGGGGIRIYFNPIGFTGGPLDGIPVKKGWLLDDEALFHELIHAGRQGRIDYSLLVKSSLNGYESGEEFIAVQLQNMYRACRRQKHFWNQYDPGRRLLSKGSVYEFFTGDMETLSAFRYFVENDPVAAAVAKWRLPADSFNPFRDINVLERIWLDKANIPRMRQIPAFLS